MCTIKQLLCYYCPLWVRWLRTYDAAFLMDKRTTQCQRLNKNKRASCEEVGNFILSFLLDNFISLYYIGRDWDTHVEGNVHSCTWQGDMHQVKHRDGIRVATPLIGSSVTQWSPTAISGRRRWQVTPPHQHTSWSQKLENELEGKGAVGSDTTIFFKIIIILL